MGPKVGFYAEPNKLEFAGGNLWTGQMGATGWGTIDTGQFGETTDSDWVPGCALLVKRSLVERIGLLYRGHFCCFEETDWCMRCRRAGHRVVWAPRARIWHKGARAVNRVEGFHLYYMTRNRYLFMKRNATTLHCSASPAPYTSA